jgi:hypothetical protein
MQASLQMHCEMKDASETAAKQQPILKFACLEPFIASVNTN